MSKEPGHASANIITGASDFDAVVVGASLAGCTSAMLLAREGARVALVEKSPDPAAFKRMCSHYIQAGAIPTLERSGLLPRIEAAGGVRTRGRIWSRSGWILPPPQSKVPPGVNLRRERLDPLVRAVAAEEEGVELMLGLTVRRVLRREGAVCRVEAVDRRGETLCLRAPLVVGADGRDSPVAKLAGVGARTQPHGRFAYAAYYEGPAPEGAPDASIWLLDPHFAAAFPTDEGQTLYAAMPTRDRLPEFKRDPAAALERFIAAVPSGPPIRDSRRLSPVLGKVHMPNVMRGPVASGLALVGDAALATDPLWGVGCGWAFESAEWLARAVMPALHGEEPLSRGLSRYRRRWRRHLLGHAVLIHEYASGRPLTGSERALYAAGARDPWVAERLERFGTRTTGPEILLDPRLAIRAVAASARRRRSLTTARPERDASLALAS